MLYGESNSIHFLTYASLPRWKSYNLSYSLHLPGTVTYAHITHLEVKELAVASVNTFCTAIAPGHFDDVNLEKQKTKENEWIIRKLTDRHYCLPLDNPNPLWASLLTHSASNWQCCDSQREQREERQTARLSGNVRQQSLSSSVYMDAIGISDYFISQSICDTSC